MCFKGSSKSSGGKCTICYYVTVTMQIAFNDEKVLLFMLLAFPYLSSHANQMPRYNPESYCFICTVGKACGKSCISKNYKCHKGRGCACNG